VGDELYDAREHLTRADLRHVAVCTEALPLRLLSEQFNQLGVYVLEKLVESVKVDVRLLLRVICFDFILQV
jgi:hypothetical protein